MNTAVVKILLVEDSPSDAEVLQEMLHQTGLGRFEFTWVERLDQSLARLREEAFDVLLLDLSLPDSTGPDTFLRARNAASQVPIVVLTGGADEDLGLEAVRHGVQDYLVKGRTDGRQVARAIRYAIERQRAEAAILRAKEEWERTFDSVPDMIAIMDDEHRIVRANRAMAERLGCTPEQCAGQVCYTCVHGTTAPPAFCPHVQTLADGREHVAEVHEERLGGDFLVSTTPLLDDRGERIGSVHVARDVTERKKREEELRRLNRTLKALGRSNQALMRAENETEFLNEACRIIVEDCGHAMVWIGYAEQDEARSVRPVACAGFEEGYLDTLKVTWAETERGRGPTGTAIRTAKPCACTDMLTDPRFAPWRKEAFKRGYASSVVLPLLADGKAFGAITIYFQQPGALSEDELGLLTELADDVAYGVAAIRLREAHARAEAALRASEERLATFAAATFEGIVESEIGRIVDCNEQFAQMVGCTVEELKDVEISDLIVPEDRERVSENIRRGRESIVEAGLLRKDGARLVVEAHGGALSPTDTRRHAAVRDITARKQAEEALRQARDQLEQRVVERTAELQATNKELKHAMAEQRRLEAEILEVSNLERQRIGQDLHDGLTQHLNGILYLSETLYQKLAQHMELKPTELARVTELLSDAVTQARTLAHGLNPVGVEPNGLMLALKRFAGTVRETFKISCRLEGSRPILLEDNRVATHLYRIGQEAVQNAIKHGKATRVTMRLREANNLITFEVRDNGVGLTHVFKHHSGMGLHIMQYRARACGGSLILRQGPRGGAWVICSVPRTNAAEKRSAP